MTKVAVTRARLNTSPFIQKSITISLMITNTSASHIYDMTLTDCVDTYGFFDSYSFNEGSAVLFYEGNKYILTANKAENEITLGGIFVPPRASVFVFYSFSLH